MREITVQVGGRPYTLACAPGQEAHVAAMAGIVDERLSRMGAARSPIEAKNLLLAALILADEVHEAQQSPARIAQLEAENAQLLAERDALADRVEQVSERIAALQRLEHGGPGT